MSKQVIPLVADDLSRFTRLLARQLTDAEAAPSHLSLMNMLARAAGFRNVQHLRAAHRARARLAAAPVAETVDDRLVERALAQFDGAGRLRQWPSRRAVQDLSLWALWARLPAGATLHERAVNALLRTEHLFEDPATLRRHLLGLGLLARDPAGTAYRRREARPPAEARALIRHLERRRGNAQARPRRSGAHPHCPHR